MLPCFLRNIQRAIMVAETGSPARAKSKWRVRHWLKCLLYLFIASAMNFDTWMFKEFLKKVCLQCEICTRKLVYWLQVGGLKSTFLTLDIYVRRKLEIY